MHADAPSVTVALDGGGVDTSGEGVELARFVFDDPGRDVGAGAATVPLRALLSSGNEERWWGRGPPGEQQRDPVRARAGAHWQIGHLMVAGDDAEQAAYRSYRALGDFLAASDYPCLLRTWNYLDRLNDGQGDEERYRRFCIGRHRAIAQPGFEARLPAATVIGCDADRPGLRLSFLAARAPGLQIENPRQTSAFQYPRDYGPVAPSFSRATLVGPHLLVSGTAAVVGHATRHPFDAPAQADEIAANLEALLVHARSAHLAGIEGRWSAQALRLYVRRPQDAAAACERLRNWIPASVPLAVLRGDISRRDLMVEVEGVWTYVRS